MAPFDEIFNEKSDDDTVSALCRKMCSECDSPFPENVALAMAYVPYQSWEDLYDKEQALKKGTLFARLDKPFLGGKRR